MPLVIYDDAKAAPDRPVARYPGMKVLVFGGRDYADAARVLAVLNGIHRRGGGGAISVVISGGAPGADTLGEQWARAYGVRLERYPADWAKHGKAAGPLRNQQMIDEGKPDLGVAFPGGRGTADMTRRLKHAGIRVIEVE